MLNEVLSYISTTKIYGFIPLDKTLHFIIGLIWTIYGLKKGYAFKIVFFGLLLIAVLKEIFDYTISISPFNLEENIYDISITILYAFVLFFVRKLKGKFDDNGPKQERWKLY